MMIAAWIGACVLSVVPRDYGPVVEVDCIELNQVWDVSYDPQKPEQERWSVRCRLSQTIAWKWDRDQVYHVDWWTWDLHYPLDYRDGWWRFWIRPRGGGRPIYVLARRVIETNTTYDPEVADRERYPEEERGGLYAWERLLNGVGAHGQMRPE